MSKLNSRIIIFDTTLRDGEQSPGAVLDVEEKIKIAQALEILGVDVIEAGFPISSPSDFKAVQTISKKLKKPTICAFARGVEKDIKIAWQAIKEARYPRLHVVISTSELHLKYQLKKTQEEVLKLINKSIKQAKSYTDDVEFSPMDATRTEFKFLCKTLELALKSGATTLNIPDTVGYALPWEMEKLIKDIKKSVKGIDKAVLSVHCHDDLGLAVANSLMAVKAGVRQVECTINGIGERAGNAALEEIAMLLKVRKTDLKLESGIDTTKIYPTSRLVSKFTGMAVQPNKAIVGGNAFAHASGIHQDGYLKGEKTYQIMHSSDVGLKSSKIVLGARSGRHALKYRLGLLNFYPSEKKLTQIYKNFLKIADKKRIVTNKDLVFLMKK